MPRHSSQKGGIVYRDMIFEKTVLQNGLTIYVAHLPKAKWQRMQAVVFAGSKHDEPGVEGVAHFLEHVLNENAALPAKDIRDYFNSFGGGFMGGMTSYDSTQYGFTIAIEGQEVERAVNLTASLVCPESITNGVEKERSIIRGEFERSFTIPFAWRLHNRERNSLYTTHVLGRNTCGLGNPETIESLELNDLQDFHQRYYSADNMALVFVGGLSPEEVVAVVGRSPFARFRSNGMYTPVVYTKEAPLPGETLYEYSFSEETGSHESSATAEYESRCLIPTSVAGYKLKLVEIILQQILFDRIREERKWCYHAEVNYGQMAGLWNFCIEIPALDYNAVNSIDAVVAGCIEELANSPHLFEQEKRSYYYAEQTGEVTGEILFESAINDLNHWQEIRPLCTVFRDIERATFEDVLEVLPYLERNRRWVRIEHP